MRVWLALAITALAVLATGMLALATVPLGAQETISDGVGRDSSVAISAADGRAMVAFDRGNNADNRQLLGRVLDRNGAPAGGVFPVGSPLIRDAGASGRPAIAYNSFRDEFFVVWEQDILEGPQRHNEIFGRRLDPNGAPIGIARRLSRMGPDDDPTFNASRPKVAYSPTLDEYLVVWAGNDRRSGLGDAEREIFGQRVSGAGLPVGADDFRISDMGTPGASEFAAAEPAVDYNRNRDEYLVVWSGDDLQFRLGRPPTPLIPVLVDNEFEIFGQRLSADGTEIGTNDFRISDAGPEADPDFDARAPDVAFSSVNGQFMVVWHAREPFGGSTDQQVYGQRISGAGAPVGANDFLISEAARDGQGEPRADAPEVVANDRADEFMIVWTDGSNVARLFGERRDGEGALVGPSDVSLASKPPDDTSGPSDVAYSPLDNRYLATWTYADMGAVGSDVIDRRLVAGAAPALPPPSPVQPRPAVFCGGRTATIVGTNRSEVLRGTNRNDVIVARGGNDTVIGRRGRDVICLGRGNDRALGGAGADRIFGQAGRDRIFGSSGADRISGGSGNDILVGQSGNDRIVGGTGRDRITGGVGRDRIFAGAGPDRANGGAGADRIFGQSGNDRLRGQAGRDRLIGGAGRDLAIGGPGADRCVAEIERSC
jgi:hypothetical protein